ncbi:MAG TPA: transposase [Isosphaeraceae bacterium]|nr:transposase [Isosphaeraceae bacterium]
MQIQVLPDTAQADRLKAIMGRFNAAANWIVGELFAGKVTNKITAQKLLYKQVRERFGLGAQTAILCIHRAVEAYKRDPSILPVFRPEAAITYDVCTLSFKGPDKVSLLTLSGRITVPFVFGKYHADRFSHPKGQSDLIHREDGKWFLLVTVDVPDGTRFPADDFLGVDMGLAEIATDSDGETHSGKAVDDVRRKHNLQRRRLQRKGTNGARKKLRRVSRKEARFRRHENHCTLKEIVEEARRTGRGIAVEDLEGIRDRVTARGSDARNRLSGWSFAQLYNFLAYKAQIAGVMVEKVDPRNTSRACAECGHCERSNRKNRSEFRCQACGHEAHADVNAARNIRAQALSRRASD